MKALLLLPLFFLLSCGSNSGRDGSDGKSPVCRVVDAKDGSSKLVCINPDGSIVETEIEPGKDGSDGKSPVCKIESRGESLYFFVCLNPDNTKYEVEIPKGKEGPRGPQGEQGPEGKPGLDASLKVKKKVCQALAVQTSQVSGPYPKFDLQIDVAYVGDELAVVSYKESHYYRAESQPNVYSASQIYVKGEAGFQALPIESTQWKAELSGESGKFSFKASGFQKLASCK